MRIPDFSNVKKRIPTPRLLLTPEQAKRAAMHLAGLYKELGGDPKVTWPRTHSAGEIAADLEWPVREKVFNELMSRVYKYLEPSKFVRAYGVHNLLSLGVRTGYRRKQQDAVVVIYLHSPYLWHLQGKLFHDAPEDLRSIAKTAFVLLMLDCQHDTVPFSRVVEEVAKVGVTTGGKGKKLKEYQQILDCATNYAKGVTKNKAVLRKRLTEALPQLPLMRRQWTEELLAFGKLADTISYSAMPLVEDADELEFWAQKTLNKSAPWDAHWAVLWDEDDVVGTTWLKSLLDNCKKVEPAGISMYVRGKGDIDRMARLMAYTVWKDILFQKATRWALKNNQKKEVPGNGKRTNPAFCNGGIYSY